MTSLFPTMRPLFLSLLLIAGINAAPQKSLCILGTAQHTHAPALPDVNPQAPKGGSLRQAAVGSYDALNGSLLKGVPALELSLTQDSLMFRSRDEPFALYPLLAESVEVAPDHAEVTFWINPQARWADGRPVTADDVIFTWQTYKTKGRENQRATYGKVTEVLKVNDQQVTFRFAKMPDTDQHDPELPLIIAMMPIMAAHFWADKDYETYTTHPVLGSGPYRIQSFRLGHDIVYERRDDYWARDLPVNRGRYNFDIVSIQYYREKNIALEAFKAGEYDVTIETDPTLWQTAYDGPAQRQGLIKKIEAPLGFPAGCFAIALNQRNPILKDIRVRRALNLLFDFGWMNKNLFRGGYTRTDGYFVGTEMACIGLPEGLERDLLLPFQDQLPAEIFTTTFQIDQASPREAQRAAHNLLAEAGWKPRGRELVNAQGQPLVLQIILDSPAHEKMVLSYKKALSQVGITLNVQLLDVAQYAQRANNYDFDMLLFRWGHTRAPGREMLFYWSTNAAKHPGTRNYNGIENPVIDALCEKLCQSTSREAQLASTRALDRVLKWGYYTVPLYHLGKTLIAYRGSFGYPPVQANVVPSFERWWARKPE